MDPNDQAFSVRGWLYVEDLLVHDDLERIDKLSEAELRSELRAAGFDPAGVPSVKALLWRVASRAAARALERAARP